MNFLRRVGDVMNDAFAESDSDPVADEDEDGVRAERRRVEDVGASEVVEPRTSKDGDGDDARWRRNELVNTAFTFGRDTLEKLKDVSKGVGKELAEGLRDIKEQVKEDLATFGESEEEEEEGTTRHSERTNGEMDEASGLFFTGDGLMITGDEDEVALKVDDELEKVGEKIELLGQKMFVGAGKILNQVKETTRDAIKETHEAIKETRDAFAKDTKPKRVRDEFALRVHAIQRDSRTYCDEPKEKELYKCFRGEFTIGTRVREISTVLGSNNFMKELFARIVPTVVDEDTFWCRYFFKIYELEIEFGRKELPEIPVKGGTESESNESAQELSVKEGNKVHARVASLATDEEEFDSDSSLAKNEWTKIKQRSSDAAATSSEDGPQTTSDDDTPIDDADTDEEIDEDWGLS